LRANKPKDACRGTDHNDWSWVRPQNGERPRDYHSARPTEEVEADVSPRADHRFYEWSEDPKAHHVKREVRQGPSAGIGP
jgi:hypothetical protein